MIGALDAPNSEKCQSSFGPSYPGHMMLRCSCTPLPQPSVNIIAHFTGTPCKPIRKRLIIHQDRLSSCCQESFLRLWESSSTRVSYWMFVGQVSLLIHLKFWGVLLNGKFHQATVQMYLRQHVCTISCCANVVISETPFTLSPQVQQLHHQMINKKMGSALLFLKAQ